MNILILGVSNNNSARAREKNITYTVKSSVDGKDNVIGCRGQCLHRGSNGVSGTRETNVSVWAMIAIFLCEGQLVFT